MHTGPAAPDTQAAPQALVQVNDHTNTHPADPSRRQHVDHRVRVPARAPKQEQQLNTREVTGMAPRSSTTQRRKRARPELASREERGYGKRHIRQRKRLLALHVEGDICEYCAKPMYRQGRRNFDGAPLEADHEEDALGNRADLATRLLHRKCNRAISKKWAKHGPGWYVAHGLAPAPQREPARAPLGTQTVW